MSGAIYVFVREAGVWTLESKLHAGDPRGGDALGWSVALDGDSLLAAALLDDNVNGQDAGSVFVFSRSGTTWTEESMIVASDGGPNDHFGPLSLSGRVLIVGAPRNIFYFTPPGRAYAFVRSGSTWIERRRLDPCDYSATHGVFGLTLASSGGVAVVGGWYDLPYLTGSAHAFTLDAAPPVIDCPYELRVPSEGPGGTPVDLPVTAADEFDPAPEVECIPPSGSAFPDGVTTVSCTATDACGNVAVCAFDVTVAAPELVCRAGNVNAGVGPTADVLFVNGQVGDPLERKLTITKADPLEIRIERPPSKPTGTSRHATYVWAREPDASTVQTLPFGIGTSCLPTPLNASALPQPKLIANTLGHEPRLGAEDWPGPPTQPAPTTLLSLPSVGKSITFFVQAVIADAASIQGQAAVTNGILVEVTE